MVRQHALPGEVAEAMSSRHTEEELQTWTREQLVKLILDLEARLFPGPEAAEPALQRSDKLAAAPRAPAAAAPSLCAEGPGRVAAAALGGGTLLGLKTASAGGAHCNPTPPSFALRRGVSAVSSANVEAAAKLRTELAQVVESIVLDRQSSSPENGEVGKAWQRLTHSNFFLPHLCEEEPELVEHVHSLLTATEHQEALEEERVINWAIGADLGAEHRLYVLKTASDGNCLLHAALLALWGVHDTQHVGNNGLSCLRAAMSRLFKEPKFAEPMRRRWELQIGQDNSWGAQLPSQGPGRPQEPQNVDVSAEQLNREWAEMVELAGRPNAFLDSVHVLALANALRRPIVILASATQNDAFGAPLTPDFLRGIYLPLERLPEHCCRQPLFLCFRSAHFMPLVPLDASGPASPVKVPLSDSHGEDLPFRFTLKEEHEQKWELAARYLEIEQEVHFPEAGTTCHLALLRREASHPLVEQMARHLVECGRTLLKAGQGKRGAGEQEVKPPDLKRSRTEDHGEHDEADAPAVSVFNVRLARGTRPGDLTHYRMPEGCTDKERVEFAVPPGCYEGDLVTLTARFNIRGHCIRALREVTNLPRERVVELLAETRGDVEAAAQLHFEEEDPADDP